MEQRILDNLEGVLEKSEDSLDSFITSIREELLSLRDVHKPSSKQFKKLIELGPLIEVAVSVSEDRARPLALQGMASAAQLLAFSSGSKHKSELIKSLSKYAPPTREIPPLLFAEGMDKASAMVGIKVVCEGLRNSKYFYRLAYSEAREEISEVFKDPNRESWQVALALIVSLEAVPEDCRLKILRELHPVHQRNELIALTIFSLNSNENPFLRLLLLDNPHESLGKLAALVASELSEGKDPRECPDLIDIAVDPSSIYELRTIGPFLNLLDDKILNKYLNELLRSETCDPKAKDYAELHFVRFIAAFSEDRMAPSIRSLSNDPKLGARTKRYLGAVLASMGSDEAFLAFKRDFGSSSQRLMDLDSALNLKALIRRTRSKNFVLCVKEALLKSPGSFLRNAEFIELLVDKPAKGGSIITEAELSNVLHAALNKPHMASHWKGNVLKHATSWGVEIDTKCLMEIASLKSSTGATHAALIEYLSENLSDDSMPVLRILESSPLSPIRKIASNLIRVISKDLEDLDLAKKVNFKGKTVLKLIFKLPESPEYDRAITNGILKGKSSLRVELGILYSEDEGKARILGSLLREVDRALSQGDKIREDGIKEYLSLIDTASTLGITHPFRISQATLKKFINRRLNPTSEAFPINALMIVGRDDWSGAHGDLEDFAGPLLEGGYGVTYLEVGKREEIYKGLKEFRRNYPKGADLIAIHSHSDQKCIQFSVEDPTGELRAREPKDFLKLNLPETLAKGGELAVLGCSAGDYTFDSVTIDSALSMALNDRPDCSIVTHDRLSFADTFKLVRTDDGRLRYAVASESSGIT